MNPDSELWSTVAIFPSMRLTSLASLRVRRWTARNTQELALVDIENLVE